MDQPASMQSRRVDLTRAQPFSLGPAIFDPAAHEAIIGRRKEHLQPQTIKVLVALNERRGDVVGRDELVERCWDGRIVGDDVINRCISILRRLARAYGGFEIETVPKAGYRLIERPPNARWKPTVRALVTLGAIVIAVVLLTLIAARNDRKPQVPTIAMRAFTSGTDRESRDLAAASAEAMAHMLLAGTFVPRLDWPSTAKEEAADDFTITGDVRDISGGFNVTVQMRDRQTGTLVFSRHYQVNRAEASFLPERIGAEMSSNISGALAMLVLDRERPVDPKVAAEFLKQIAMIVQGQDPLDSYRVSRALADQHPQSALPQLALAFSTGFALGSLPFDQRPDAARRGREAAQRALALAPYFGDAYFPLCMLGPQWRLSECEKRMRQGMKADPGAPYLPAFLSDHMLAVGRHEEALALARATLSDQPYQPQKLRRVIQLLLLMGYETEGSELYRRSNRWWPDHPAIHADYLHGFALRGNLRGLARAIREMPREAAQADRAQLAVIVAAWNGSDPTRLQRECTASGLRRVALLACIGGLEKIGDHDTALELASKLAPRLVTGSPAGDQRIWLESPYDGVDPVLASPAMRWLRRDPRYLGLLERVGLVAYWRSGNAPDFCSGQSEPVCRHLAGNSAATGIATDKRSASKNRLSSI